MESDYQHSGNKIGMNSVVVWEENLKYFLRFLRSLHDLKFSQFTSPVPPSSGTLRGSKEEAAQGNPGGGVCKMISPRRISLG